MWKNSFFQQVLSPLRNSIECQSDGHAFFIAEQYYSYAEFGQAISKIRCAVHQLHSQEQVFGLAIHDDLETYAAIFALWMEGKAYVPLHPNQPLERNLNIISQVGLHNVIDSSEKSFYVQFNVINPNDLCYECDFIDDWKTVNEEALAYILFTSGSTGVPKGVPISRGNLAAFIEAFWKLGYDLTEKDRCLQCFDLTFDLSVVSYLVPLLVGACLYTVPYNKIKWSYSYFLLDKYRLNFALMTPSTLQYMKPYFSEINLPYLRYSLFCGESLSTELTEGWAKCIPYAEIDNVYGPTENTVFCTAYRFRRDGGNIEYNGILSIGASMSSGKIIIVDENDEEVKGNRKGELCLSGRQLTQGYWHNPEKNRTSFWFSKDGNRYYRSGDLCFYGKDGNVLFVGRKDSQIKIDGYRVELGEIEYHAGEFLGCRTLAMAVEKKSETIIVLFVEKNELDNAPLISYLGNKLPHYMIPGRIVYEPCFPMNSSNKVDRNLLKQRVL